MKIKFNKKYIPIYNLMLLLLISMSLILCGCIDNNGESKIIVDENFLTINLEEEISLPIMINDEKVHYTSNNENINIDENNIIGVKEGSAIVYGYNEKNKIIREYVIKVNDTLSHIEINGINYLKPKETYQFSAKITPNTLSQEVIWTSSDENIATVNEDGLVNAIGEGLVTITATSKHHSLYKDEMLVLVAKEANSTGTDSFEETKENITINSNSLESIFYPLIDEASSYVIGVNNYQKYFGQEKLYGIGSGIIYKRQTVLKNGEICNDENIDKSEIKHYKYYVVTNKHVVINNSSLSIYCNDIDYEIDANLIQYDSKIDLAVISFETKVYFPVAKFSDCNEIKRGEFCIALGHPFGYELANTSTFGIISHETRYISADTDNDGINDWDDKYIQHDAAINEGNSGGPLINLKGEVIGINSLKISSTKTENMGFAIPSNTIIELIGYLEKGIQPERPTLGVQALEVKSIIISETLLEEYSVPSNITYGIYISEVISGGVAYNAGVQAGDIILSLNGVEIYYTYLLRIELNKFIIGSGESCEIIVYRNNQFIKLTAIF